MYVVVDTITGQWVTEPLPYADAATLVRMSMRDLYIEEVED